MIIFHVKTSCTNRGFSLFQSSSRRRSSLWGEIWARAAVRHMGLYPCAKGENPACLVGSESFVGSGLLTPTLPLSLRDISKTLAFAEAGLRHHTPNCAVALLGHFPSAADVPGTRVIFQTFPNEYAGSLEASKVTSRRCLYSLNEGREKAFPVF